jgi:adenine-specific DNA-methyltransferase
MARIEDLIQSISEPRLREEFSREVKKLKAAKKFGLVFEEHLPETTRVLSLRPQLGDSVAFKSTDHNELWQVAVAKGTALELRREGTSEERTVKLDDVVVVRRFGEAIFPSLVPIDRIERGGNKPWHALIQADNYHALQLLLYTYESKVDVIYIDPPYNTGARDWKYNNDYVDLADLWRHSKWLAMMKRRLVLAKRLLRPENGAIIVTIDEHEVHHLGMLLEEIFPDSYRQMVTIVVNPKGVTQGRFSRVEEHALFCFMQKARVFGRADDFLTPEPEDEGENGVPRWKGLLRSGESARREDRPDLFYPVLIDSKRNAVVGAGEPLQLGKKPELGKRIKGYMAAWPVRMDGSLGRWGVKPATLRFLIEKGYVSAGSYDEKRRTHGISYLSKKLQAQIAAGAVEVVKFDKVRNVAEIRYASEAERQIKSVWHRTYHDAGAYGSDLLKRILGRSRAFSFPKSLYAVRDSLGTIIRDRPNALVLDFFAGSGTTLHAVALLNAEDGGSRRCVLVTNNEVEEERAKELTKQGVGPGHDRFEREGICQSITWPRVKFAIAGKRDDGSKLEGSYLTGSALAEGFEENAEYFKLDFLDPHRVARGEAFEAILPILWMMADCRGQRETSRGSQPWFIPKKNTYAVLLKEAHFVPFCREVRSRKEITNVFLVTDSEDSFRDMASQLEGYETTMLYKSYLETFRINTAKTDEA